MTVGAILAVTVLPGWFPREMARWHEAWAEYEELEGNLPAASAANSRALWWTPDDFALRSRKVTLQFRLGDAHAALQEADAMLADFQAAMPDPVPVPYQEQLISLLNQRAYARALAGKEVEAALQDVNHAMTLLRGAESAAILDTRGYILHLLGRNEDARRDMERAVSLMQANMALQRQGLYSMYGYLTDQRNLRRGEQELQEGFAVLLHHRGLVYQSLGKDILAKTDLDRAQQLGYGRENGVW